MAKIIFHFCIHISRVFFILWKLRIVISVKKIFSRKLESTTHKSCGLLNMCWRLPLFYYNSYFSKASLFTICSLSGAQNDRKMATKTTSRARANLVYIRHTLIFTIISARFGWRREEQPRIYNNKPRVGYDCWIVAMNILQKSYNTYERRCANYERGNA